MQVDSILKTLMFFLSQEMPGTEEEQRLEEEIEELLELKAYLECCE